MLALPEPETDAKMRKVQALSDAIQRAKEALAASPSQTNALAIQRLVRQRAELRGTLPPLKAVA